MADKGFHVWNNGEKGRKRRFFWHFKSGNGEIVFAGEPNGYHNRVGAMKGINIARETDVNTPITEEP